MSSFHYVEAKIPFIGEFGDVLSLLKMTIDERHELTRLIQRTVMQRLAEEPFAGEHPQVILAGVLHYPDDYQFVEVGFRSKAAAAIFKLAYGGER